MRYDCEGKANKKVGQMNVLLGYEMNFPVNKYGKTWPTLFTNNCRKFASLYAYCIWENDFEWEKAHTNTHAHTFTHQQNCNGFASTFDNRANRCLDLGQFIALKCFCYCMQCIDKQDLSNVYVMKNPPNIRSPHRLCQSQWLLNWNWNSYHFFFSSHLLI